MNYTRHFECGCKVVVIGELTNAEIHYCPKHKAASDMYEALLSILIKFPEIPEDCEDAYEQAEKAISKAEGK